MSKQRYTVISYLDFHSVPTHTQKKVEECRQYFGHTVIWDYAKAKVVAATPYNVYCIDPMHKVARVYNLKQIDRELYIKQIMDYAGE